MTDTGTTPLTAPAPRPFPSERPPSSIAVSVVIATRDRSASLRRAAEAVLVSLRPSDELIVVDSASTDPGVRATAQALGATVVHCAEPGTSRARNAGAGVATGDVIAFTDDDCLPRPDWVPQLATRFARYPDLGFLTGAVHPLAEGRPRRLQLSVTSRPDPIVYSSFVSPAEVTVVGHGANMAWRRSALDRIGGFDTTLGPGAVLRAAEDQDAFWRARRAGIIGRYEPAVVVDHRQWRTWGAQMTAFHGYGVGAGAMWVKRWRSAETGGCDAPAHYGRDGWGALVMTRSGRRALRALLWDDGAGAVARRLREGYQLGALSEAVELAGALAGARRAWRRPIVDGHFV